MYHTLCHFGLFIFKSDCVIAVTLKAMLNAAGDGYELVSPEINTAGIQSGDF